MQSFREKLRILSSVAYRIAKGLANDHLISGLIVHRVQILWRHLCVYAQQQKQR